MAFLEFYKKGQGSIGRLLALAGMGVLALWGAYALWVTLQGSVTLAQPLLTIPHLNLTVNMALVIAVVVGLLGLAFVVWLANRAKLVDLLIETEAEMRKVSWPSRQEAWNSSVIVVITVVFMMALLFGYDFFLNKLLSLIFYPEAF